MADMLDLLPKQLPRHIVYEKADASGPYDLAKYCDPAIRIVLKTAVCDWRWCGEKRPHKAVLDNRPPDAPAMTREHWAKAVPGPCFGAYRRLRPWVDLQWPADADRKIDVFFAGSVDSFKGSILEHRQTMLREALRIERLNCSITPGRTLTQEAYRAAMLSSRIALVPWGWGELSHRLYEAWHAGCVPLMPETTWVRTWWGRLTPGEHYWPCRPDWRDLAHTCHRIKNEWPTFEAMRERNRQLARSLVSDARLATWWRGLAHHG